MSVKNPFSREVVPAPDGLTYRYADPRYGEFACLTTDAKRQAYLDRLGAGLLPAQKPDVALSKLYRNRKSHALDLSRWIKFNTHDGRTLADFWQSIMDRTNREWTEIKLEHALEASRLLAAHGFARFGPVNEAGKTDGEVLGGTLWEILQAARQRQALPAAAPGETVEGEVREVCAEALANGAESKNDPSADPR